MSMSQQEAIQMKTDVEILKASTNQVLNAIAESVEAQKENSKLINELVFEMKERDVRDEYRSKELKELKGYIKRVDEDIKNYIEEHYDSLKKLSESQKTKEVFIKSVSSTWGKVFAMLLIAAFAYAVGVDLTKVIN